MRAGPRCRAVPGTWPSGGGGRIAARVTGAIRVASVFIALGAMTAACASSPLPGKLLGTYKVQASPQSNGCGSALGVPDPWTFDVQISESGSTLYWSWLDGTPPLSNTLSSTQSVTLTTSESGDVDTTADGGAGPCTMQRSDTVALTLGSGTPPSTFQGSIQYVFSAASGAVCTDQLSASGGSYAMLPCTVILGMTAAHQ